jgi:glycosyltransferase involved in cell wall biosynthesis
MTNDLDISIVVPLFNEEESVRPLYDAITGTMDETDWAFEIILVDDGSDDDTFTAGEALAREDHRVKVVKFRRNYGQTPAMAAGIDHASGNVIVTMDGDLQNDPKDIPDLVAKLDDGYQIAVGWRHKRKDKLITRKVPSVVANWLIGKVTGVPIKDNGCSLKAFRADVIKSVPLYSEMHRFIPAMASMTGARTVQMRVRHHARQFGVSKYGLSRIFKVLGDLLVIKTIVSFASRPMLWFGMIALPIGLLSITLLGVYLFDLAGGGDVTVVIPSIGILLGALAFFLVIIGALAELIVKTGDGDIHALFAVTANLSSHEGKQNA